MNQKYVDAICVLSEMLINKNNEICWKETQLELRDKEIEKLRLKLEYIEQYIDNVSNGK